jgi:ribose transport system substrate-binding protein
MSNKQLAFLGVAAAALLGAAWFRYEALRPEETAPLAPVDVAFVTGGSGPYWQLAVNGARAAAKDLNANLDVQMPSDSENLTEQMAILEELDAGKIDGVAVSPIDAAGQTVLINALAKKTNVITFDSDAPDSTRKGYVGTSNFAAGRVCARLAHEALPDGGKIAVILANTTKDNLQDRKGGFQEMLFQISANAKEGEAMAPLDVVGFLIDEGNDEKCAELIRETLADHADLACFVGMNARHGPILRKVLNEAGKLGQIKVIAFDDEDETLAGVEAGDIYATVAQDPFRYGYEAVRMLCVLSRADESQQPIGATTYSVNVETIRQENLEAHRAKVKSRQGAAN